jgi:hypothetical protein
MQVFRLVHFTVASLKQYALELSHYLSSYQMQPLLQQMLPLAVFTLMEFHLLSTLMRQLTIRITYTDPAVLLALARLALW